MSEYESGPKVSKWEGEEPVEKQAPKPSNPSTPPKTSGWEGEIPQPKKKNKVIPIVIAAALVVAVIGGIVYWREANRYDTTVVSYNEPQTTSTVETAAETVQQTAPVQETAATQETVASTQDHGFELDHDPVAVTGSNDQATSQVSQDAASDTASEGKQIVMDHDPVSSSGFRSVTSRTGQSYNQSSFAYDGKALTYDDGGYTSRLGVDVSYHQGDIDWHQVKEAGVEFAFIRLGYRGYGEEGKISMDSNFVQNIRGAQNEGIDVGVYFFSQAISEEEAEEEADFVISTLEGYKLQLPVAYDLVTIIGSEGRTSNLSPDQLANNAEAFCTKIRRSGNDSVIAFNDSQWPDFENKLDRLSSYNFWYGNYEMNSQPPFKYDFLQYSNNGRIPGINTVVDLDIQMLSN